jgi:tRNA threonylcarbamoyladenosine biosynthesis protein TsaB
MAIILNLETATTNCSVSIATDGELLAIKEHDTPNYSHSEQLHVFIQEVVQKASLTLKNIDAVAVSKGPGSYTGLRIGVSAAKGLCFALDVPLISIATLTSMAHQVNSSDYDFVIPLLDARRMEVYSAVFDCHLKEVRETIAEVIDATSFSEFTKKGKVLLVGSGAQKCSEILKHSNINYDFDAIPSAKEMARLSYQKFQRNDFEDLAYFEPFYLKDFILQKRK